jgi:hypothetical protein
MHFHPARVAERMLQAGGAKLLLSLSILSASRGSARTSLTIRLLVGIAVQRLFSCLPHPESHPDKAQQAARSPSAPVSGGEDSRRPRRPAVRYGVHNRSEPSGVHFALSHWLGALQWGVQRVRRSRSCLKIGRASR